MCKFLIYVAYSYCILNVTLVFNSSNVSFQQLVSEVYLFIFLTFADVKHGGVVT